MNCFGWFGLIVLFLGLSSIVIAVVSIMEILK